MTNITTMKNTLGRPIKVVDAEGAAEIVGLSRGHFQRLARQRNLTRYGPRGGSYSCTEVTELKRTIAREARTRACK